MNAPVSPAATVLNDLVATMQAIKNLYDKPGELTDTRGPPAVRAR
jgi:hypothetical protein